MASRWHASIVPCLSYLELSVTNQAVAICLNRCNYNRLNHVLMLCVAARRPFYFSLDMLFRSEVRYSKMFLRLVRTPQALFVFVMKAFVFVCVCCTVILQKYVQKYATIG